MKKTISLLLIAVFLLSTVSLSALAAESGAECVMVGDTEHDARGAAEAGVPFIGVRYGFGDSAEMAKYPMAGPADSPADVLRMLKEGHYI